MGDDAGEDPKDFTLYVYQAILQRAPSLEALLACRNRALTLDGQHTIDAVMFTLQYACACRQEDTQLQQQLLAHIRATNHKIRDANGGLVDATLACGLTRADVLNKDR